jgi:hypothetical protein
MARGLNFSEIDRVPDEAMNAMLWKAIKGEGAKVPVPVRAAFVKATAAADNDD